MSGTILFVSAQDPAAAARAVAESPAFPQVCVISPTAAARQTASAALDGRWAFIAVEPLLAPRASAESGAIQPPRRRAAPLDAAQEAKLAEGLAGAQDGRLKDALMRLGRGVLRRNG